MDFVRWCDIAIVALVKIQLVGVKATKILALFSIISVLS